MKTIDVSFTESEALALCRLIDLAVKAGGLSVAQAGVTLNDKIVAAAEDAGFRTNLARNGKAAEPEVVQN